MRRRKFIQVSTALTGALLTGSCDTGRLPIPGEIVGASASIGHLLRDGKFNATPSASHPPQPGTPSATPTTGRPPLTGTPTAPLTGTPCRVAIIGGGISGLSAARWLKRQGIDDICVLDLEKHVGGNAASGRNAISAYPWGAHYIPTPNNPLHEYLQFLEEANVITGYDAQGLPIYNDYFLCFDPQERLYLQGNWQTDLVPRLGLPAADQGEITRFLHAMQEFRSAKGADGLDAFAIPIDTSSKDPVYTSLDSITMSAWLNQNGYNSPYLRWYVNYCMRDDFGTPADLISAWTGVHYFASRKGKGANAQHYDVLTWPQGNGWLVEQLSRPIADKLKTNALAINIDPSPEKLEIKYYDVTTHEIKAIWPEHIIVATPQFVTNRLLPVSAERLKIVKEEMHYTPWMVANLTVRNLEERSGAPLSWDNVLYDSQSLGYVEATHQKVRQIKEKNVLTYYWPLTAQDSVTARQWAAKRTHAQWVGDIIDDLKKVHPDIEAKTERIDIMLWGHAMAQPRPGWIHGGHRQLLQQSFDSRIHFAHTDLAGISIFEEGFYQGIRAAEKVLKAEKLSKGGPT